MTILGLLFFALPVHTGPVRHVSASFAVTCRVVRKEVAKVPHGNLVIKYEAGADTPEPRIIGDTVTF